MNSADTHSARGFSPAVESVAAQWLSYAVLPEGQGWHKHPQSANIVHGDYAGREVEEFKAQHSIWRRGRGLSTELAFCKTYKVGDVPHALLAYHEKLAFDFGYPLGLPLPPVALQVNSKKNEITAFSYRAFDRAARFSHLGHVLAPNLFDEILKPHIATLSRYQMFALWMQLQDMAPRNQIIALDGQNLDRIVAERQGKVGAIQPDEWQALAQGKPAKIAFLDHEGGWGFVRPHYLDETPEIVPIPVTITSFWAHSFFNSAPLKKEIACHVRTHHALDVEAAVDMICQIQAFSDDYLHERVARLPNVEFGDGIKFHDFSGALVDVLKFARDQLPTLACSVFPDSGLRAHFPDAVVRPINQGIELPHVSPRPPMKNRRQPSYGGKWNAEIG